MTHFISRKTIEHISESKSEPAWLRDLRAQAFAAFEKYSAEKSGFVDFESVWAFIDRPEESVPSHQWPTDLSSVVEERGDEEGLIIQRDSTVLSKSMTKEM